MNRFQVGNTDLELSVVGLGGAWLGHHPEVPSEVAGALSVLNAVDACGVNWVDTSENYFDTGNEAVIGRALNLMDDSFLVCSKVAPGAVHSGGGSGFKPDEIRRACEASLNRLGRDRIDVYLLHWPDDTGVPLADTWGAMASLVDDGLVRTIGLSNYDQDDIAACHRQRPVDVIQTGLSVIDYLDDRDMIAWCGREGIAVTIYEPLASGALSGLSFEQARQRWIGTAWEDVTEYPALLCPENAERVTNVVDGLRRLADELGATVAQVAIAWLLRQPGVSSAIVGSSNAERAQSNSLGGDLHLPDEALRTIDEDLVPLGPAFA